MIMALLIFHYAKDGLIKCLCSALNQLDSTCIERLISQEVVNHQGERMTPLIAAIRQGHDKVVKLLVERFNADVNKCGVIRLDNTLIGNASPLWIAAGSGYIEIVKELIDAGADVNHRTDTGSTPIRAACFDGRLEIVKYLTHCGADIEIPNSFDNTCLMIAAFRGHYETVSFLLDIGADPNKKALCGATALHFAAEFGSPRLIRRLLQSGAVISKTHKGFTPVMLAAEHAKEAVVELFTHTPEFNLTKQEIIDAFELLGASFANDQKSYDLQLSFHYLRIGMSMRFQDPENPILKPDFPPVPAYGNRVESKCMEDLDAIMDNEDAIHMEALALRERLLGPSLTNEATIPIVYRGVLLAEEGHYDRCIALWLHRLQLLIANEICVSNDILRFTQMFSRILAHHDSSITMDDLTVVLQAAHKDLINKTSQLESCDPALDRRGAEEEKDGLIFSIMELLVISTLVNKENTVFPALNKTVFDILKLGPRISNCRALIHLATDPSTRVNDFLVALGVRFPYEPLASLLMDCGANVNDTDCLKNTPLHLVVSPLRSIREFSKIQKIIHQLLEKGAHMDAVNHLGHDPMQLSNSLFVNIILKSQSKVKSLKCLAARAVCKHDIVVPSFLPAGLNSFVDMHGRAERVIMRCRYHASVQL